VSCVSLRCCVVVRMAKHKKKKNCNGAKKKNCNGKRRFKRQRDEIVQLMREGNVPQKRTSMKQEMWESLLGKAKLVLKRESESEEVSCGQAKLQEKELATSRSANYDEYVDAGGNDSFTEFEHYPKLCELDDWSDDGKEEMSVKVFGMPSDDEYWIHRPHSTRHPNYKKPTRFKKPNTSALCSMRHHVTKTCASATYAKIKTSRNTTSVTKPNTPALGLMHHHVDKTSSTIAKFNTTSRARRMQKTY
jgi:hypothetical protein